MSPSKVRNPQSLPVTTRQKSNAHYQHKLHKTDNYFGSTRRKRYTAACKQEAAGSVPTG